MQTTRKNENHRKVLNLFSVLSITSICDNAVLRTCTRTWTHPCKLLPWGSLRYVLRSGDCGVRTTRSLLPVEFTSTDTKSDSVMWSGTVLHGPLRHAFYLQVDFRHRLVSRVQVTSVSKKKIMLRSYVLQFSILPMICIFSTVCSRLSVLQLGTRESTQFT